MHVFCRNQKVKDQVHPIPQSLYVRVPAAPLPSGDIELPIYYVAIHALLDEGNNARMGQVY